MSEKRWTLLYLIGYLRTRGAELLITDAPRLTLSSCVVRARLDTDIGTERRRKANQFNCFIVYLLEMICITHHEDFKSIVLLKNCLWTALVALHDRESRKLPKRDEVPNR